MKNIIKYLIAFSVGVITGFKLAEKVSRKEEKEPTIVYPIPDDGEWIDEYMAEEDFD